MKDQDTVDHMFPNAQLNVSSAVPVDPRTQDQMLRTRDSHSIDLSTAESIPCPGAVTTDLAEFNVATGDDEMASQSTWPSSASNSERLMMPRAPGDFQRGGYFACPYCYESCRLF